MEFNINIRATKKNLLEFADKLKVLSDKIGFKISSRGWAYQLEVEGIITKAEFDKVENLINKCRKKGILPIDFTAEEEGRKFSGVEEPTPLTPVEHMKDWLQAAMKCEQYYTPDWWEGEDYYIQMVVEKIDLKTLFSPVCQRYHIPIATSKGWSSMLQRAIYARRFKEAEDKGLTPVLLYCGDHDPDGLRISDFLKKNLLDLNTITWEDGEEGYDTEGLEIVRFGLDYDFIERHHLSWINNLITGSKGYIATMKDGKIVQGRTKAGKPHPNFKMKYAQEYLKKFGVRKCEANAIVPMPQVARSLVESEIIRWLGEDSVERFRKKRNKINKKINDFREKTGLQKSLQKALDIIDKQSKDE